MAIGAITSVMKKIIALAVSVILAAGLTGCKGGDDSTEQGRKSGRAGLPDVIKVAVAGPMTDSMAQYGKSFYYGAQLKADELNKKGGILGKEIEILVYDDMDTVAGAEETAGQIVEENGVAGVIGHLTPQVSITAAEIYNSNGMINILPIASTEYLLSIGDYIFESGGTIDGEAAAVLDIAVNDLKKQSIGIVAVNSDWGTSGVLAVKKAVEEQYSQAAIAGLEQVESTDYSTAIANLKAAGADVIIAAVDGDMLAPLVTQCSQSDGLEVAAFPIAYSKALFEEKAQELNGVHIPLAYVPEDNEFTEGYERDYGSSPGALAAQAYDSTGMLLEAVKAAKSIDGSAVREKLESLDYSGVTGKSRFDEDGQVSKSFTKFKMEDGKLTAY
jgi:ABC-type branched-chain amino acid transport systems, periplasmic component